MKTSWALALLLLSSCASPVLAPPPVPPPFSISEIGPAMLLSQPLRDPKKPQIVEVYVLPQKGMAISQIRANIPGLGVVDLLHSPSGEVLAPFAEPLSGALDPSLDTTAEQAALTGLLESGKANIAVTAALKHSAFSLAILVRNTGSEPVPIALGWNPRFAILSGKREQARLRLPTRSRLTQNKLTPTAGTAFDFGTLRGKALAKRELDDSFGDVMRDSEDQMTAELIDPASHYGLRLRASSPDIKAFQISAPSDENFVGIAPRYNLTDSTRWAGSKEARVEPGIVSLSPGETARYTVELELFVPAR